jgi:hypothetical protein
MKNVLGPRRGMPPAIARDPSVDDDVVDARGVLPPSFEGGAIDRTRRADDRDVGPQR